MPRSRGLCREPFRGSIAHYGVKGTGNHVKTAAAHRGRLAGIVAAALALTLTPPAAVAARLAPESILDWNRYVAAAESRMQGELDSGTRFLGLDFDPDAAAARRAVLAGQLSVSRLEGTDRDGRSVTIRSATINHWRGAVFIRGATVAGIMEALKSSAPPVDQDVLRAQVLERGSDQMRLLLRIQRRKIITVVYDTEHVVRFRTYGATRGASWSTATKIAEVENPGRPEERELPEGDDRGFLWKLNAYWRYEEVPGGVIAECESMSLSRDVPYVLRAVASSLIESAARESMERTLIALRARFSARR